MATWRAKVIMIVLASLLVVLLMWLVIEVQPGGSMYHLTRLVRP